MLLRTGYAVISVCSLLSLPVELAAGSAEEARVSFEKGNELIRKADLAGAVKAYAVAAKADGSRSEYRSQYMALRQVMTLREALPKEKNAQKWAQGARMLHDFYRQHGLFGEALPLNEEMHRRFKDADSAVMLAGTQLVLGKAADAEKVLSALDAGKATPLTNSLLGIALGRQDKKADAKAVLSRIEVPKNPGPDLLYNLACVAALAGEKGSALGFLMRTLETTPETRHAIVKAAAKVDKDLASISASPEFASVLQTLSKAKDPNCVGDQCIDPAQTAGKGGKAVDPASSAGLLVVK